jgi:predicted amidohydrolase YtcJ
MMLLWFSFKQSFILSMKKILLLLSMTSALSCQKKQNAEVMFYNAHIYTLDALFSTQEAMVVKDGLILDIGTTEQIKTKYTANRSIDLNGKYVYPGFNDAHTHFYGLGVNLEQVNLVGTKSFDEVVEALQQYQKQNSSDFIIGRGWDQNDWQEKTFPTKDTLDDLFSNTPIVLTRIDGHAMLVNQKALDLAGININTQIKGGEIVKKNGELTGVLIDEPMNKINAIIPELSKTSIKKALKKAEKIAFKNGLTSITDAGLSRKVINIIQEMQRQNELKIRINAMVGNTPEDVDYFLKKGVINTPRLRVGSVKVYADGALGSRGAALKQPYSDQKNHYGAMLISLEHLDQLAKKLSKTNFQMNTHAIGDSANSVVLKVYQKYINDKPNKRWRVEHAQVIDPEDYHYFSKNIIPSVQPTHATSDMYWAEERLGAKRIKYAYAYKTLLDQAGVLPLGTDFPVENVNPLLTFYAAVSRQDTHAYPKNGFQMQNALTRKQALKGMTIWPAYAAFEEDVKGSLGRGKYADFVVLNKDLLSCDIYDVIDLKVQQTFVGGENVYDIE